MLLLSGCCNIKHACGTGNPNESANVDGLIFNPFYREAGIEVGFYADNWLYASASAGSNLSDVTSNYTKDPTYTARLELTPRFGEVGLMIGGSYAAVKLEGATGTLNTNMYGGFFGFGYDEFSLLAEYDMANGLSKLVWTSRRWH